MTSENPPPSGYENNPWPDNQPPGYQNHPPPGSQPPGYQNYPPQGNQPPGYQNYPPQGGEPYPPQQWNPTENLPPGYQPYPPQQGNPTENLPPGYQPYPPQQGNPTENLPAGYQPYPPPPQGHSNRGKLIASVAAVVVLAGGGTATYLALASSNHSGASSPTAAVQQVVSDLEQSDLLGVLDDLPPGERTALSGAVRSDIDSLKRLGVLAQDANGSSISGISFKANGITYGKPITINDHVQVVPITGGSVDVSADAAKLPFTRQILSLMSGRPRVSQHIQIPPGVRIAAQKVGGGWYTSIFYTAADSAAGHRIPSPADAIPATGAATPEGAVESFVRAAMNHDSRGMIGLISPDELGALHDYGGMIAGGTPIVPHVGTGGATLKSLQMNTEDISGGVRVTPSKIVVSEHGHDVAVTLKGNCLTVAAGGRQKTICAGDLIDQIASAMGPVTCFGSGMVMPGGQQHGSSSCSKPDLNFTPQQKTALTHLVQGLLSLGVDTSQSDGKWYITPVRTYADITSTLLGALQGNDLFALASLAF